MTNGHQDFYKRLRPLHAKHKAMANGYSTHLREDGLIIVKPHRAYARQRGSLWSNLVVFLLGAFAFKCLVLYSLGEISYQSRIDTLVNGNQVEQAGAWIMQIDPATRFVVDQVIALTR